MDRSEGDLDRLATKQHHCAPLDRTPEGVHPRMTGNPTWFVHIDMGQSWIEKPRAIHFLVERSDTRSRFGLILVDDHQQVDVAPSEENLAGGDAAVKQDALHDRGGGQHASRQPRRLPVECRGNLLGERAHVGAQFSLHFSPNKSADRCAQLKGRSERNELNERFVWRLIPLAFLSPTIVHAIAEGRLRRSAAASKSLSSRPNRMRRWAASELAGC